MVRFTRGNLLEAQTEAVVNTVNEVGVMGKGIALMFKEAFPANFDAYEAACKLGEVRVGRMLVVQNHALTGPKWIINFPTKKHWRQPTKLAWVHDGLKDLRRVVQEKAIQSIAVPPLGCGNGGLAWNNVRAEIEVALGDLPAVEVLVYEPTAKYQAAPKHARASKLTPARAMVAEMVRRYWVLGIECTYLEVQKLGWFLERSIKVLGLADPLRLQFNADRYGPYSDRMRHLLNALDGGYLHCSKRLSDAGPLDTIWFDEQRKDDIERYFGHGGGRPYFAAVERTAQLIDGFESPLGMELLATVDWLLTQQGHAPTLEGVRRGLRDWPGGREASERKLRLFNDHFLELALERLAQHPAAERPGLPLAT
jgi:O-acetyl-ADP-ribose deacetylase (regulator of RNase III)